MCSGFAVAGITQVTAGWARMNARQSCGQEVKPRKVEITSNDAKQINQYQLDSLAKYVLWTRHPSNYGGWGIYNLGPIPEGIVAWFIGLAALVLVARLIGERMESE